MLLQLRLQFGAILRETQRPFKYARHPLETQRRDAGLGIALKRVFAVLV
jgi:hypothetical protein